MNAPESSWSTTITLEPWEYEHGSNVGIRRYTANWGKQDAPHYKKELMEDDRTAVVAAALCELAVAKYTNRYWHAHIWPASDHNKYRDLPDVGKNIEVRRIRTGNRVAIRKHQLGKQLIVWAAYATPPEFRQIILYGWQYYDEAWHKGEPSNYSPDTTRLYDINQLKSYGAA